MSLYSHCAHMVKDHVPTTLRTCKGEGMKILYIKDHVRSSINDFRERNRAITNPSFAVGRLN